MTRLETIARSWIGTPCFPHGRVKGPDGGCSCQTLIGCILQEAGWIPGDLAIPEGPLTWSRSQKQSLIEPFMDENPILRRFFIGYSVTHGDYCDPQAGDVLGFRIGGCVHHLGLVVRPPYFIHALIHRGAAMSRVDDPTYARRLARIWRRRSEPLTPQPESAHVR